MRRRYTKDNIKELQDNIDNYINEYTAMEKPLTFSGLAYALGFSTRQTLNDYVKRKDETSLPIKRAMLRIEQGYEERLALPNSTGSIFALKNRGWRDKPKEDTDRETNALNQFTDILNKALHGS